MGHYIIGVTGASGTCYAKRLMEKLLEACRQELGEEPALSYHIGGVIAINAGPNLIGIIYRD